jgi:hypothetical protein
VVLESLAVTVKSWVCFPTERQQYPLRWACAKRWSGVLETPSWSGVLKTPSWNVVYDFSVDVFCKLGFIMKSSRIYHPSISFIRLAWYSTLNYDLFDMIDVV